MATIALWIAGLAAGWLLLDRLGVWAEKKGWIYWRKRGKSGAGFFFDALDIVYRPEASHVVQAKDAKKLEERDNGDPPELRG